MKRFLLVLICACVALAQTPVNQVGGPPPSAFISLYFYDASNNLQYECRAPQSGAVTTWTKAASTLTNIVDSSNTATLTFAAAHKLYVGARITIAGVTTDPDLNGTYVVKTVPLTTTATITTASVTDTTYTDAGMTVSTSNPLTSATVWAIHVFTYDASNLLTAAYWATAATTAARLKCDDRATY